MKNLLHLQPFLFLSTLTILAAQSLSLSPDGLTLLSIRSAVDTSPAFSDWNENDTTPCHWPGISCMNVSGYPYPRVVGITLAGRNLRGYIPSELGTLIFLRRLDLHGNNFHGSLPVPLFNATSLHGIFLSGNNLSGILPPSICHLPRLQNLDLSNNSFSGTIPRELGNCRRLQRLIIAGNRFSGWIPEGIWSELSELVQLDLSRNELNGSIPADLGGLQSLTGTLNLSFNELSGNIPESLGNLPLTVSLDLRSNNLSGEIPQTGSFSGQGPTAFLNNPFLCGFPLQRSCSQQEDNPSESGVQSNETSTVSQGKCARRKGLDPGIIVLISAADAALVAFVGLIIVYVYWKKRKDDSDGCCCCAGKTNLGLGSGDQKLLCGCLKSGFSAGTNDQSEGDSDKGSGGGDGGRAGKLVALDKGFTFELDELLRASAYVLGKSGLGIVYKVVLGNGVPVAVRRLGEGGEQRCKEFAAEVQAIGKVRHPNIVRLRAYYWAPDEKLLISDFISNGNLATALRGRSGKPAAPIPWTTRLKVAKGTARGLAYLHECSPRKLVHGDIKPSNILLDQGFQPHISDFGLTQLVNLASSAGGLMDAALPYVKPTTRLERSSKYLAPEARVPGSRPTQKWDVYSFGVILLELLTGKSPELTSTSSAEIHDLVRWVRKGFEEESPLSDMIDPFIMQEEVHTEKEVVAVFHLALACTGSDPEVRPSMKTVSEKLGT